MIKSNKSNWIGMCLSTRTLTQQIDGDMKQTEKNRHEIMGVGGVNSHSPLDERILNRHFPAHTPTHLPEHGDAYRLFFEILLATLPLENVRWVEDKNGCSGPPKNTTAKVFHRRNWRRFQKELGAQPSLYVLNQFTIDWLKKKCPENKLNEFKWHGFTITPLRIETCVTRATYAYGMARLSCRADGHRVV